MIEAMSSALSRPGARHPMGLTVRQPFGTRPGLPRSLDGTRSEGLVHGTC